MAISNHVAFEAYKKILESGVSMTLREFAERSEDILGERVPESTVKTWSGQNDWVRRISLSFDSSEELRQTKDLLDIARDNILHPPEDVAYKHFAMAASAYRKLLRKVPKSLALTVESEIIEIREVLYEITTLKKDSVPMAHWGTMTAVWADLATFLVPEVQSLHAPDSVDAGSIIMRGRGG